MTSTYDAIMLIAFGAPTSPEEIRPFLARVTKGLAIPSGRLEAVAHHYETVGGRSPLNEITFRQATALEGILHTQGKRIPVYAGMRNAAPFLKDTLEKMAGDGVKRVLGFILSSHRTEASWERYQQNIADARATLGAGAPVVDYCEGWHDHPLFIQTWVELIESAYKQMADDKRTAAPLAFTAHSLPISMATRSPYVEQLQTSARMISQKLGRNSWSLAYQSRSGKPSDPWLEPDIGDTIRKLAEAGHRDVVVAPIGFVADHVEVLYDLDIEARRVAAQSGINLVRASCPNDHPTFIRMMADVIRLELKAADDGG